VSATYEWQVGARCQAALQTVRNDTAPPPDGPRHGCWSVDASGGISGFATGKGVSIAIRDNGFDVYHPGFWRMVNGVPKSRILAYWDPLFEVADKHKAAAKKALEAVLGSGHSAYATGRFWTQAEIDILLAHALSIPGAKAPTFPLPSRDWGAHGTACGLIAASSGVPWDVSHPMGVAPEADIIAIKHIAVTADEEARRKGGADAAELAFAHRIANPSSAGVRPLVVSESFGRNSGLNYHFRASATPRQAFVTGHGKGVAVVHAAGNDGGETKVAIGAKTLTLHGQGHFRTDRADGTIAVHALTFVAYDTRAVPGYEYPHAPKGQKGDPEYLSETIDVTIGIPKGATAPDRRTVLRDMSGTRVSSARTFVPSVSILVDHDPSGHTTPPTGGAPAKEALILRKTGGGVVPIYKKFPCELSGTGAASLGSSGKGAVVIQAKFSLELKVEDSGVPGTELLRHRVTVRHKVFHKGKTPVRVAKPLRFVLQYDLPGGGHLVTVNTTAGRRLGVGLEAGATTWVSRNPTDAMAPEHGWFDAGPAPANALDISRRYRTVSEAVTHGTIAAAATVSGQMHDVAEFSCPGPSAPFFGDAKVADPTSAAPVGPPPVPALAAPGEKLSIYYHNGPDSAALIGTLASLAAAGMSTPYLNLSALDGTSFSCPAVAGTVALMLEIDPTLTQKVILNILHAAAVPHPAPTAQTAADIGAGALCSVSAALHTRWRLP